MPAPHEVALTPEALADLDRLDRFLRDRNPTAANRLGLALDAALRRLATSPRLGRPVSRAPDLRALVVRFGRRGYVVLYELRPGLVLVARIHHAREDR